MSDKMQNKNILQDRVILENYLGEHPHLAFFSAKMEMGREKVQKKSFRNGVASTNMRVMSYTLRVNHRDLYVCVHNRLHDIGESLFKRRVTYQANFRKNRKKRSF